MKKIQKHKSEKGITPLPKNGKIKVGGKIGVDIEATPDSVTGRGGIAFVFQLPTLLALNLFKRISEQIKQNHDG